MSEEQIKTDPQAALLFQLAMFVRETNEEQRERILECKLRIDLAVKQYGEDGLLALAICGLEGAIMSGQNSKEDV